MERWCGRWTFTQALLEWAYDNGPSGLELLCTHKTTLLPQSGTAYAAAKVWEFALNQPSFAHKVENGEMDGFMCCLLVHVKNELEFPPTPLASVPYRRKRGRWEFQKKNRDG